MNMYLLRKTRKISRFLLLSTQGMYFFLENGRFELLAEVFEKPIKQISKIITVTCNYMKRVEKIG